MTGSSRKSLLRVPTAESLWPSSAQEEVHSSCGHCRLAYQPTFRSKYGRWRRTPTPTFYYNYTIKTNGSAKSTSSNPTCAHGRVHGEKAVTTRKHTQTPQTPPHPPVRTTRPPPSSTPRPKANPHRPCNPPRSQINTQRVTATSTFSYPNSSAHSVTTSSRPNASTASNTSSTRPTASPSQPPTPPT